MCESSVDLRILCGRRPCKLMYSIAFMQAYVLYFDDGYRLLKQHPCSHANAEALVSHFVTCIYVCSLQLSWIQYTWRLHYMFLCMPLRLSTKLAQIYKPLNVCSWLLPFSAWICVEFLPRFFCAELRRQSECVRADIPVCLRRNIEEFFRTMDVIHVRYYSSYIW